MTFGRVLSLLAFLSASPTAACQLALSLALDVSSSVDEREFRLQADGLANALNSPEVAGAILSYSGDPIALHVYQWSGQRNQLTVLDWTFLRTPQDLAAAIQTLRDMPRSTARFPTALGNSLGFGAIALRDAPQCARKTLDISGDGRNNHGFGPAAAYRYFPFANVTVNGLAIGGEDGGILDYYRREVISGPGAFVEFARDFDDFERAMRRKLLREIGEMSLSLNTGPSN